jgi:hypothetical protein
MESCRGDLMCLVVRYRRQPPCGVSRANITSDDVPLRRGSGVDPIATNHQSTKSSSASGGPGMDLIQDRTSYHIVLEKEQTTKTCYMHFVPYLPIWSLMSDHKVGSMGGGSPHPTNMSSVQQRSRQASQTKT